MYIYIYIYIYTLAGSPSSLAAWPLSHLARGLGACACSARSTMARWRPAYVIVYDIV